MEQGMDSRCPKCGSPGIRLGYPDMYCLRCGWSEPLIDFPISWDWHRFYAIQAGLPDPGPDEPTESDLTRLEERMEILEQTIASLSAGELKQIGIKRVWDEVQALRRGLHSTQKYLGESIRQKKYSQRAKLTEV